MHTIAFAREAAMADRGRNLVVCCDGTGNVWKPSVKRTNVVKLLESLAVDPNRQVLYYDPGVGTPDGQLAESDGLSYKDIVKRVAGLAWGRGVWTNVAQGYGFLMENYEPGDRIYFFGFSRGAFTVRAIAGLINVCGLMLRGLDNLIPTALAIYRMKARTEAQKEARKKAAEQFRRCFARRVDHFDIHFIGVWDTVETVGISQLLPGSGITSDPSVKPLYRHVRHAVALDELRWPYQPRLYIDPPRPADPTERSYKQVWFAGAHSDIGGGYAHDGLANATLHWMAREANAVGLQVDFDQLEQHKVDALDKLHDESVRIPFWTLLGVFKRNYPERLVVHESVVQRRDASNAAYRPLLPAGFAIEKTAAGYKDLQGVERKRPVPVTPLTGPATKQSIRPWHWIALTVAAAVTAALLMRGAPLGQELARMQLLDGWGGQLGSVLLQWQASAGASVRDLLLADYLLIAAYVVLLAVLMRILQRFEGRNGYPSRGLGKAFCFSGFALPVADVIEDLLTSRAVLYATPGTTCEWLGCDTMQALASIITSIASLVKTVALLAVLLVLACTVVKAVWGQVLPPARQEARPDPGAR
jgi:uncharacterized protein (DUF2235 family)